MKKPRDLFIGWSSTHPNADRRFMLGAGLALTLGAGALGAAFASRRPEVGDGFWDTGAERTLTGHLSLSPYLTLRTLDFDGAPRTVFIVGQGKTAPIMAPALAAGAVTLTGTLITRGRHAMMTLISAAPAQLNTEALAPPLAEDRGPVALTGEVLDAKCWFGAMRPGFGKTHKSCAALCARGGLPLAFCRSDDCATGAEALLLLDQNGQAFGREILPLVADPVWLRGRLVAFGDVLQVRAALGDIRRL